MLTSELMGFFGEGGLGWLGLRWLAAAAMPGSSLLPGTRPQFLPEVPQSNRSMDSGPATIPWPYGRRIVAATSRRGPRSNAAGQSRRHPRGRPRPPDGGSKHCPLPTSLQLRFGAGTLHSRGRSGNRAEHRGVRQRAAAALPASLLAGAKDKPIAWHLLPLPTAAAGCGRQSGSGLPQSTGNLR